MCSEARFNETPHQTAYHLVCTQNLTLNIWGAKLSRIRAMTGSGHWHSVSLTACDWSPKFQGPTSCGAILLSSCCTSSSCRPFLCRYPLLCPS